MKTTGLKQKILASFITIILGMSFVFALFRIYVIKINIIARAQNEVKINLKAARTVYESELQKFKLAFSLISADDNLQELKNKIGLDYLYVVSAKEAATHRSDIVRAAFNGYEAGGSRIIPAEELQDMGESLRQRATIGIRFTPKAKPTQATVLQNAMALEYAQAVRGLTGEIVSVLYGGEIINRDFRLTDKIRDLVFENKMYDRKPVGTVTIFQEDVRIATNVLDSEGNRAIGTRVSQDVYERVITQGKTWIDRAFVVTDWYLTAYEPLRDIKGAIIGILYVGILEKPFMVMQRNILIGLFAIMACVLLVALLLAIVLAEAIAKPLTKMLEATAKISGGNLSHTIDLKTDIRELNELAASFNQMAVALKDRELSVKVSNEKLAALNKSYLELIGFVAHELKGILSSTILNAYSVRDGFLGMINFKQRKALDSVTRSLDYFSSTIRNFFNLSRIEKQELNVNRRRLSLKNDVFESSIEAFTKLASEKGIQIIDRLGSSLQLEGDQDLLQIVANNLIGNAIKYGQQDSKIQIDGLDVNGRIQIEVYNDGRPLNNEEKDRLFKKFSRLQAPENKREKGTGLGLFIAKEIIEKHGGDIWVESKERGNSFIFRI